MAEGVETKEQLGFLRTCNCNLIQGYYFARPLPEDMYRECLLRRDKDVEEEDILQIQSEAAAVQLLFHLAAAHLPAALMT